MLMAMLLLLFVDTGVLLVAGATVSVVEYYTHRANYECSIDLIKSVRACII